MYWVSSFSAFLISDSSYGLCLIMRYPLPLVPSCTIFLCYLDGEIQDRVATPSMRFFFYTGLWRLYLTTIRATPCPEANNRQQTYPRLLTLLAVLAQKTLLFCFLSLYHVIHTKNQCNTCLKRMFQAFLASKIHFLAIVSGNKVIWTGDWCF